MQGFFPKIDKKGVPKGWHLAVRDFLLYSGAKYICPCTGTISPMPGTSSSPAFRKGDVNVKTGKPIRLPGPHGSRVAAVILAYPDLSRIFPFRPDSSSTVDKK